MTKKKHKPMTRSENMSRIKGKDTKPEMYLRKLLWHKGFRYRCNYKGLKGKPDIFMKKYKTAVFVNGCFWHVHKGCSASSIPVRNRGFWEEKLFKNKERDKRIYEELNRQGIKVIVVWECTLKKMKKEKELEENIIGSIESIIYSEKIGLFREF